MLWLPLDMAELIFSKLFENIKVGNITAKMEFALFVNLNLVYVNICTQYEVNNKSGNTYLFLSILLLLNYQTPFFILIYNTYIKWIW